MASLTLSKGSNLSLTKADPGLQMAMVGLGWDPRTTSGDQFDLDASAILVTSSGKVRNNDDFIFYNQLESKDGSVVHQGDNRVVNQQNDQEIVRYDLSEDAASETTMVFAEIYRNGAEWKFRAVGQGYASGLHGIATDYGIVLD